MLLAIAFTRAEFSQVYTGKLHNRATRAPFTNPVIKLGFRYHHFRSCITWLLCGLVVRDLPPRKLWRKTPKAPLASLFELSSPCRVC